MTINKWIYVFAICVLMFGFSVCQLGCGSSSGDDDGGDGGGGGGTATGATLTGTVDEIGAAMVIGGNTRAASGVTVSIGDESTTTGADGSFTLNDIPTSDEAQDVTFTDGTTTAVYSLTGVGENETFTLNGIDVDGSTVSTAHTGTWSGIMTMDVFTDTPVDVTFTLTIDAGGNSISGGMSIDDEGLHEVGTFSGTENGTTLDARWALTEPDAEGCLLAGPLTGTFDGNTLEGNEPIDDPGDCELFPGDDDPDSHPFTLTKE